MKEVDGTTDKDKRLLQLYRIKGQNCRRRGGCNFGIGEEVDATRVGHPFFSKERSVLVCSL